MLRQLLMMLPVPVLRDGDGAGGGGLDIAATAAALAASDVAGVVNGDDDVDVNNSASCTASWAGLRTGVMGGTVTGGCGKGGSPAVADVADDVPATVDDVA